MFKGIPVEALDFYEDLEADNSKAWWTAHKSVYDSAVAAPFAELLAELEPEFGPGKIFRPYRDVRFSKDKTPYKIAQGAVVRAAPGTGYYVQVSAAGLFVGGGFYSGTSEQIAHLRGTIDDDVRGPELQKVLERITKAGFTIGGDKLKTQPRGYDADHPRIDLLRHKSITASKTIGSPKWLHTARAAKEIRADWESVRPLVEWMSAVVS